MKGVVFTFMADHFTEQFGVPFWNEVLDTAGEDGVYTSGAYYPDEEVFTLLHAVSSIKKVCPAALLKDLGDYLFPQFIKLYPHFIQGQNDFLDFLEGVETVIHSEVRKLHPAVQLPRITYDRIAKNELHMHYHSERRLCSLAEGLIDSAARAFSNSYQLSHKECMHKGDDQCTFRITTSE